MQDRPAHRRMGICSLRLADGGIQRAAPPSPCRGREPASRRGRRAPSSSHRHVEYASAHVPVHSGAWRHYESRCRRKGKGK